MFSDLISVASVVAWGVMWFSSSLVLFGFSCIWHLIYWCSFGLALVKL